MVAARWSCLHHLFTCTYGCLNISGTCPLQVAAGSYHSCAAVTGSTQAVRCWGPSDVTTNVPSIQSLAPALNTSSERFFLSPLSNLCSNWLGRGSRVGRVEETPG